MKGRFIFGTGVFCLLLWAQNFEYQTRYIGLGFWLGIVVGIVLMSKWWSKWFSSVSEWIDSLLSKVTMNISTEIKRIRAFNKANRQK